MKKNLFLLSLLFLVIFQREIFAQGINLDNFDKSVKPQENFYYYVNGSWLTNNEIPKTEGAWGAFYELREHNRVILKEILDESLKKRKQAEKGSPLQQVGDLYASGMNEERINSLVYQPIQGELNRIEAMESKEDMLRLIAHHQNNSVASLFYFYVRADSRNSTVNAAHIWQYGTSLPSRDYYLEDNEKFTKIREEFIAHVSKMFQLIGIDATTADANAQIVMKIEMRLAQAQRSPVQNRDPQRRYNKKTLEELSLMTFNFNWNLYFEALGAKNVKSVVIAQPEFIGMVDRLMQDFTMEEWKTYFTWKLLTSAAPYLSDDFVKEDFYFFSTVLRGVQEMNPRWKRVQATINSSLGEPLGQLYVAEAFPPEAKQRMEEMIQNIREAFAERIKNSEWMSKETQEEALEKLASIVYKIGYPDKWKDYSSIEIKEDDYFGNLKRITQYEHQLDWAKIGQPVDKSEWGMTPPTVNAYYNPTNNEIVFPAGILQPPFFDFNADDALNYGGIGAVIGHEITHGFDDQGSQYDAEGNLRMWWTEEDRARFEERAEKLIVQYDNYTVLDNIPVNGKLTLGENIADLGGVTIAYDALMRSYQKNGKPSKIDNFTAEQRFFIGYARIWRAKYREEVLLNRVKTDPHSPGEYRSNGVLANMPAFFEAFAVKEKDPMRNTNEKLVKIW